MLNNDESKRPYFFTSLYTEHQLFGDVFVGCFFVAVHCHFELDARWQSITSHHHSAYHHHLFHTHAVSNIPPSLRLLFLESHSTKNVSDHQK